MLLYGKKLLESHLIEETYNKWPEWQKIYVKIKILTPGGCLPLPQDICIYIPGRGVRWAFTGPLVLWFERVVQLELTHDKKDLIVLWFSEVYKPMCATQTGQGHGLNLSLVPCIVWANSKDYGKTAWMCRLANVKAHHYLQVPGMLFCPKTCGICVTRQDLNWK